MLAAAAVETHERVLDLGAAGHPVALKANAAGIHFVSSDLRAVRLCEDAIRSKGLPNACAWLETSPAGVTGPGFDVVLYAPARWEAKARVFQLIDAAFQNMAIHGRFLLAGRRDAGVESYRNRLEEVFGDAEKLSAKSGLRIFRSNKRNAAAGTDPVDTAHSFVVNDPDGVRTAFETCAGVFSSGGLDAGTRFLIDTVDVRPHDRVLDLGSGFGAIGIAAARRAGEVLLLDSDLLAVQCGRWNVARNGLTNARVALSDGYEAASRQTFDLVLCNAPTHKGTATARLFTEGAARHLVPDGRFMIVTMRPGMYLKQMKRWFRSACTLASRGGYAVLRARTPNVDLLQEYPPWIISTRAEKPRVCGKDLRHGDAAQAAPKILDNTNPESYSYAHSRATENETPAPGDHPTQYRRSKPCMRSIT